DHIFIDKSVYREREPRRGEIMVFDYPEDPAQQYVKRVIAVPGDVLELRGRRPWINGWEVPRCKIGVYGYGEGGGPATHWGDVYVEYVGAESYLTMYDKELLLPDHQGPFVVQPGEYWVLGDNRNNAHDSP